MRDEEKTQEQLIGEVVALRQRIANWETAHAERQRAEEERRTLARLGTRLAGAASVEAIITVVREESAHLLD